MGHQISNFSYSDILHVETQDGFEFARAGLMPALELELVLFGTCSAFAHSMVADFTRNGVYGLHDGLLQRAVGVLLFHFPPSPYSSAHSVRRRIGARHLTTLARGRLVRLFAAVALYVMFAAHLALSIKHTQSLILGHWVFESYIASYIASQSSYEDPYEMRYIFGTLVLETPLFGARCSRLSREK